MTARQTLASWNDSRAKTAILDFVARVTKVGGPDFVPPADRIAVFDNDGTLWCEQPVPVHVFFLIDRVKEIAAHDRNLEHHQPFKALLEHDLATLHALGKQALVELTFATHAGMSEDELGVIARRWMASARHPELGALFTECTYQPQLDLLDYLREHGFKTFIVSGGGVELIRTFAARAYGIPREQVIGSSAKLRLDERDHRVVLTKVAELQSYNNDDAKPQNISLHIGRRPLIAFGNSDGDLAMLRYTMSGPGKRLALLLHHDDAVREFAYDREFHLSPLVEALDRADEYGITVVSMRHDWHTVFGDVAARATARR